MLAVVGNLSIDRVEGSAPRIGGGSFHAARALAALGAQATIVTRCADEDRDFLQPQLEALELPVRWLDGDRTARFSFSYDGDVRAMNVDAIGETWTLRDAQALDVDVRWLHVAPLLRSDFPVETVADLARGRRLLLDGQGLVRKPQLGPLELDANFDRHVLRHVTVLKLAVEEAEVVGDVDVPELVVTFGSGGSLVRADGRETHVPTQPLPRDRRGREAAAMRVLVETAGGAFAVDLETEEVEPAPFEASNSELQSLALPRVVASARAGSTVVAVVDRKPPLVVSYDAGATWREVGGGLPPGRAVAIAEDDPDLIVYASRNRLHVSTDGGVFWRALTVELPELQAVSIESS